MHDYNNSSETSKQFKSKSMRKRSVGCVEVRNDVMAKHSGRVGSSSGVGDESPLHRMKIRNSLHGALLEDLPRLVASRRPVKIRRHQLNPILLVQTPDHHRNGVLNKDMKLQHHVCHLCKLWREALRNVERVDIRLKRATLASSVVDQLLEAATNQRRAVSGV